MIKDLELSACLNVLANQYIGHLAFISGKSPYVLPITYFHDTAEKCILSYSALGHKIEAMRKYDEVALYVGDINSIQKWQTVLIHGRFEELDGSTAKKYLRKFSEGVQETIHRVKEEKPKFIQDFSSRLQEGKLPIVYKIHIIDITGKCREN